MKKKNRFGTCTKDCYGACVFNGLWIDDAQEQKFIHATPLKSHPFTNGFFCPKYTRRQDLLYHSKRIKKPLLRNSKKPRNNFNIISSHSALDIIAQKVYDIKESGDPKSIIGTFYSGNSGLISRYSPLRFFAKLGATITNGGICNEGGCAGLTKLFGTYSISNPFQIIDPVTGLIVIWGSNLSQSNIHAYFLVKQSIKNETKLVVVDSRITQIAKKSDIFLQIYPGTEHLLAKLLIKSILKRNAHDIEFLKKNVDQYLSLFSKLDDFDEKALISQIGINFDTYQRFVDLLVTNKHQTLFMIGYGVQKDFFGGRIVQSIASIQILLGNIAKRGTGLIYSQSDFINPIVKPLLDYITQSTTISSFNEIPVIKLGEALSSGEYKLLFVYNFNPVSSLPNQNVLRKALLMKDLFVVVLDMFLNETTKYADVVIPAKFDLESYDIIKPYYIPSLSTNIGGPCPYPDCVSNYEFFQQLSQRMVYENSPIFKETEEDLFHKSLSILPSTISKNLRTKGYHLLFNQQQIPFNNLKFPTPNHKIQFGNLSFDFGQDFLNQKLQRKLDEFVLISPSHSHFLHSQLGPLNSKYFMDFSQVFLNPEDISTLELNVGEEVVVSNEFGSDHYTLAELENLKIGTALIYSGGPSTYEEQPNVNFFTSDVPEELGYSGAYYSTIIQIQRINKN
ncbi:MAG: molybdopterin-dependent oxidoreductase [Candidatus Lokiarchaeota archaeon]|nr:molybdopterin-dependent oxidoreductase [Candidatus Lokiarchaeota archaeon]